MSDTNRPLIYHYEIVIKRTCSKNAPARFRGVDFNPGDVVPCFRLGYPGESLPGNRVNDTWSFWEDYDIDTALIFGPEDISEIRCNRRSRWAAILQRPDVPVPVIWQGDER